jgi:plastocyanin
VHKIHVIFTLLRIVMIAGNNSSMQTTFIGIADYMLNPKEVTVQAGTQIRWDNNDSVSHSLETYDTYDDSFKTGPIAPHQFYELILSRPGKAQYWCVEHKGMHETGIINVEE